MPNTCGEGNTFSDISNCASLPLDDAFKNYMKGGDDDLVGNAAELFKDMIQDGGRRKRRISRKSRRRSRRKSRRSRKSRRRSRRKSRRSRKSRKSRRSRRRSRRKSRRSRRKSRRSRKSRKSRKSMKYQRGGRESIGYYPAIAEPSIGGRSEIKSYSSCDTPVFPVDCRDLRGGSRRRRRRRMRRRSKRKQRGGNDPYKLSGLPSNFSPDMNNRQFGCRAPYWTPKCV